LVVDRDGRVVWSTDGVLETAWSHHGHRLAWVATGNALIVTDIDTGAASTWYASSPDALGGSPDWSPDDTRIALTWYEGTGPGTLRIVADDGSIRDLFQDPSWMAPRWSPDGRLLSVVTRDDSCGSADDGSCPGEILIIDAATGARVDGIRDLSWVIVQTWSPDGTRLAWDAADPSTGQVNLFVGPLPLATGTVVQVTDWPGNAGVFGWTNDGTGLLAGHIVMSENMTGREPLELWRVPVDPAAGEPVLLRSDVIGGAELQPTP
jgi:Tol biopolymer transport system component